MPRFIAPWGPCSEDEVAFVRIALIDTLEQDLYVVATYPDTLVDFFEVIILEVFPSFDRCYLGDVDGFMRLALAIVLARLVATIAIVELEDVGTAAAPNLVVAETTLQEVLAAVPVELDGQFIDRLVFCRRGPLRIQPRGGYSVPMRLVPELTRFAIATGHPPQTPRLACSRLSTHSQNITMAARAQPERKTFGHRS